MRITGAISTAVLSLMIAVPAYAQQEPHEQEEQKAKPAQDEKKAHPEKPAEQRDKRAQQEEKNTQQRDKNNKQEEKSVQQEKMSQQENRNAQQRSPQAKPEQHAQHGNGGRIPDDRYRANFGREHRFRVSQAEYGNRRFQYGGYSFGFVDAWPSNWLYTQDVFVVEIDGVYYLCNASYPGVNLVLNVVL
jgi:hypothetical protein